MQRCLKSVCLVESLIDSVMISNEGRAGIEPELDALSPVRCYNVKMCRFIFSDRQNSFSSEDRHTIFQRKEFAASPGRDTIHKLHN